MAYSNFYAKFFAGLDKIKNAFATIFRFRPSFIYLGLVVFWQLVAWFQVWFIDKNLSSEVLVLHYNVDFGIDLVGNPSQIYLYPLLGIGVFLINLIILAILHKDKNFKILVHFLLGAAVLFGLFLSVALLSVYLINFR
jgi:hypothetical protein